MLKYFIFIIVFTFLSCATAPRENPYYPIKKNTINRHHTIECRKPNNRRGSSLISTVATGASLYYAYRNNKELRGIKREIRKINKRRW